MAGNLTLPNSDFDLTSSNESDYGFDAQKLLNDDYSDGYWRAVVGSTSGWFGIDFSSSGGYTIKKAIDITFINGISGIAGEAETLVLKGSNDSNSDWDSKSWTTIETKTSQVQGSINFDNSAGTPYTYYRVEGSDYVDSGLWYCYSLSIKIYNAQGTYPHYADYESFGEASTHDVTCTTEMAYLSSANGDTNYGGGGGFLGKTAALGTIFSTIRFDIRDLIGYGGWVKEALLKVKVTARQVVSSGTHSVSCYRLLQDWNESQITWNDYSTGNAWNIPGANALSDTVGEDSTADRRITAVDDPVTVPNWTGSMWLSFDVTEIIQSWMDGTISEYGFLLSTNLRFVNGDVLTLAGPDAADANKPYLQLTYLPLKMQEGIGFADTFACVSLGGAMSEGIGFADTWDAFKEDERNMQEGIGFADTWDYVYEPDLQMSEEIGFNDGWEVEQLSPPTGPFRTDPKKAARGPGRGSRHTSAFSRKEYGKKPYMAKDGPRSTTDRLDDGSYQSMMERLTGQGVSQFHTEKHSEFKKPYQHEDYPEMEHFFDDYPWRFDFPSPDIDMFNEDLMEELYAAAEAGGLGCILVCYNPMYCHQPIQCHAAIQQGGVTTSNSIVLSGRNGGFSVDDSKIYPIEIIVPEGGWASWPDDNADKVTIGYVDHLGNYCDAVVEVVCNDCDGVGADFEYDTDNTPETINQSGNITVTVKGGVPPFHWEVSGTGLSFDKSETEARTNTLNAAANACGSGKITVNEGCGYSDIEYVRVVEGSGWVKRCDSTGGGNCHTGGAQTFTLTNTPHRGAKEDIVVKCRYNPASCAFEDCSYGGVTYTATVPDAWDGVCTDPVHGSGSYPSGCSASASYCWHAYFEIKAYLWECS